MPATASVCTKTKKKKKSPSLRAPADQPKQSKMSCALLLLLNGARSRPSFKTTNLFFFCLFYWRGWGANMSRVAEESMTSCLWGERWSLVSRGGRCSSGLWMERLRAARRGSAAVRNDDADATGARGGTRSPRSFTQSLPAVPAPLLDKQFPSPHKRNGATALKVGAVFIYLFVCLCLFIRMFDLESNMSLEVHKNKNLTRKKEMWLQTCAPKQ